MEITGIMWRCCFGQVIKRTEVAVVGFNGNRHWDGIRGEENLCRNLRKEGKGRRTGQRVKLSNDAGQQSLGQQMALGWKAFWSQGWTWRRWQLSMSAEFPLHSWRRIRDCVAYLPANHKPECTTGALRDMWVASSCAVCVYYYINSFPADGRTLLTSQLVVGTRQNFLFRSSGQQWDQEWIRDLCQRMERQLKKSSQEEYLNAGRYLENSPKGKSGMKLGEIEMSCVLTTYPK